ncbi:hypothetical protein AAFF_G00435700 [Aldrovandia affinis]|uniref:Uncharacterized protein n=1 Tax=Aldrovandia affinis TaxID=143900 RepID=A0AAD7SAR1_9TELE|nr:hypothetical protein AAFF_G00435700 [Aldrovandia affinis]
MRCRCVSVGRAKGRGDKSAALKLPQGHLLRIWVSAFSRIWDRSCAVIGLNAVPRKYPKCTTATQTPGRAELRSQMAGTLPPYAQPLINSHRSFNGTTPSITILTSRGVSIKRELPESAGRIERERALTEEAGGSSCRASQTDFTIERGRGDVLRHVSDTVWSFELPFPYCKLGM